MSGVSVVVIAKNEAANIERCLKALAWCDDVVVIDDHSTDGTGEIAAQLGARVLTHKFESFAAQRNWAIDHANLKHEWSLHLDADEVSTEAFAKSVQRAVAASAKETAAFRLCRKTMFRDCWLKYSDGFPVWIMRIVRHGRARFEDSGHGETPVPKVYGDVLPVREPFLHYPFSKGLADWFERHNRYSTREANLEHASLTGLSLAGLISTDPAVRRRSLRGLSRRLPFRPLLRFLYQYVAKLGFLDGRAGFDFSAMMAAYELMIVQKRRELSLKDRGTSL